MAEKIEGLLEDFRSNRLTRREFIHRALVLPGSLAAATTLVDSLRPTTANAAQVDPSDPALTSSDVNFAAPDGAAVSGYLTRPKGDGAHPAVMVIHAWSGIDEHTRDVGRRLAKAGYVALVPDLLSRVGGTSSFSNREAAIAAGQKLGDDRIATDLAASVN